MAPPGLVIWPRGPRAVPGGVSLPRRPCARKDCSTGTDPAGSLPPDHQEFAPARTPPPCWPEALHLRADQVWPSLCDQLYVAAPLTSLCSGLSREATARRTMSTAPLFPCHRVMPSLGTLRPIGSAMRCQRSLRALLKAAARALADSMPFSTRGRPARVFYALIAIPARTIAFISPTCAPQRLARAITPPLPPAREALSAELTASLLRDHQRLRDRAGRPRGEEAARVPRSVVYCPDVAAHRLWCILNPPVPGDLRCGRRLRPAVPPARPGDYCSSAGARGLLPGAVAAGGQAEAGIASGTPCVLLIDSG